QRRAARLIDIPLALEVQRSLQESEARLRERNVALEDRLPDRLSSHLHQLHHVLRDVERVRLGQQAHHRLAERPSREPMRIHPRKELQERRRRAGLEPLQQRQLPLESTLSLPTHECQSSPSGTTAARTSEQVQKYQVCSWSHQRSPIQ